MSKTSRPDRRNQDRSQREPKEFEETTLSIDRVTRVVGGGRRMRFRAVVVVGNKKGKVGLGTGKATEVREAIEKATTVAKRSMIRIPILNGTIPHEIDTKYKAARIRLIPASEGTGVIAGGALRVVLEHAGVKNVFSKRYGSSNKLVNAQAILKALSSFRCDLPPEEEEKPQKKTGAEAEDEQHESLQVKTVSKKDVKDGTLKTKKDAPKAKKADAKEKKETKKKPAAKKAPAKKKEKKD